VKLPYVIDNQAHRLADVLNDLLADERVHALDIATAYFNAGGFALLRERLAALRSFRLLLGHEPGGSRELGLYPSAQALRALLRGDLDQAPFTAETLKLIEDLIGFLWREDVDVRLYEQGFLHAKAYLFFGDDYHCDRFTPVAGIVGSSNWTRAGLTSNRELNLTHKAILDEGEIEDDEAREAIAPLLALPAPSADRLALPGAFAVPPEPVEPDPATRRQIKSEVGSRAILELVDWFDARWAEARDFKADLIALLDESKFGAYEYTPYQIYLKALFEYLKDDLGEIEELPGLRSAVELARFQEDAVKKARRILMRYDGVMIADSVGLGKTWIGKKLLEDLAYHMRQKAVVICPASLRAMWRHELAEATIPARILSQEEMGREEFALAPYLDADVVLIDESHNFRNRTTHRYENLGRLIGGNGGRGRQGTRKKLILLTATPINNNIFDLYNQVMLFAQNDRTYFAAAGIGDVYKFFLRARQEQAMGRLSETAALFNLLEEIVVRRTRTFIRRAYPEATIRGRPIRWPERRLRTIRYNLEETYEDIYDQVVAGIESLRLAPYSLEDYKRANVRRDDFELGRQHALVGIFQSRYLKRFESSVEAFRISVRRALEFVKTFESYVLDGKVLDSRSFQKAMRYLDREGEEDDATPASRAAELDASAEAQAVLEGLPELDPGEYDLRRLHEALQHDVDVLTDIWHRIRHITPAQDAKLAVLKGLLSGSLGGQKTLVFTYYKDTARYLYRELAGDEAFVQAAGQPHIRRIDSGLSPRDRGSVIAAFAPRSNQQPELAGSEREIDVLVSTDVLSEGQNLQDCGFLINYDLHWNPTRMVQRAGRIDRIGSQFDTLWIYNMFPDEGLERLLRLVENLSHKIETINRAGFLDASVLGEVVTPRNFNTLRRIEQEDDSVIEEQEEVLELASGEMLLAHLRDVLAREGREKIEDLPDGIHSGLARPEYRGLFFYFTGPDRTTGSRQHFWRYYDLKTQTVRDNRYEIAQLIACEPDTPRVIGEADVFAIQEQVIDDILRSVQQQQAIAAAPKIVDEIQNLVSTVLQEQLNNPDLPRKKVRAALKRLRRPLLSAYLRDLQVAYDAYQGNGDAAALLEAVGQIVQAAEPAERPAPAIRPLQKQDLHLVCWEYIWS
jgi:superfamily II DNA or RNA helicase